MRAATWGGLAQFLIAAFVLLVRFKSYFVLRAQQYGPHIGGTTEVIEAGIAVFITLEYLVHPVSFLLLYLAIEGLARFAGGLIAAEVLPSFLVFLGFKAAQLAKRRVERREKTALPPDTLEKTSDGRIRIACAEPRQRWNASITIGMSGEWFEVERTETGAPPRPFLYVLRPASPGKVLRGYEEYDLSSAVNVGPLQAAQGTAPASPKAD
ncbi:MAG TPA: hypothetical protein VFR84_05555 [Candidatus Angelobacter sp.]|nr:hypothetical protein [Candidatus Angelobacter sp.]